MTDIGKGMLAGFIATAVLSMVMLMKSAMGLMPNLSIIAMMAGMMGGSQATAWIVHFLIGTVLWGVVFAWLDPHLPGAHHWTRGIVFGIGAWLLMMIVMMPMAGAGFFGIEKGIMAPAMTLVLHMVWGAVLGGAYGWLLNPHEDARAVRHS